MVERHAVNVMVVGSNPTRGATLFELKFNTLSRTVRTFIALKAIFWYTKSKIINLFKKI